MSERIAYTSEFPFNARPQLVYNYIATPSGLATWFADDVNVNEDIFTFIWDGEEEKSRLVRSKRNELTRFEWIEREGDEYLEFRISQDELSGGITLTITDYEDADELEEARMVMERLVESLRATIGG